MHSFSKPEINFLLQIVFTLEIYGVKNIVGIQYGYRGFFDESLPETPVRIMLFFFVKDENLCSHFLFSSS